jgi:hypothetical protein
MTGASVTYAVGGAGTPSGAATVANTGSGGRGGRPLLGEESTAGANGIVIITFPSYA